MKTTDGYELEKNNVYYLSNGETVIFNEGATTPEGRKVFLVTPLFEGETMEASGDGGFHHERSMNYEHEGKETLVKNLFKSPPIAKLAEIYKSKLIDIEGLSLCLKLLTDKEQKLAREIVKLNETKKQTAMKLQILKKELSESNEESNDELIKVEKRRKKCRRKNLKDYTSIP